MSIKLVVFDLDDTIIVNEIPFSQIRERIFRKIGVKDGPKHLYEFLRDLGDEYVKLLEKEEIWRARESRIHPSLPEILKYLDSKGIKKVVLTRNSRRAAEIALGEYISKFDCVITRDDGFEPKPSPDALLYLLKKFDVRGEECLVVGDYLYDMESGKRAGCITVCIGDWDADYKIKNLGELLKILEGKV